MKKLLVAGATALALLSAGAASAQTTHGTYPIWYGGTPGQQPWLAVNGWNIPNDTTPATPNVTNTFTLTGTVAKDCSYAGSLGEGSTHQIPLGAIGVKNGNSETTANAFNQAADFNMDISTTSAGCNFNNTVTVSKASAQGLVNSAHGGFDSNQFTANIPYRITAGLTGTTNQSAAAPGAYIGMVIGENQQSNSETLGAWRSNLNMGLVFPAQTKGLVAGTYTDTITVTLQVL